MRNNFIFFSPLEQFQIYPLFLINLFSFDVSITNQTLFLCLVLFFFIIFYYSLKSSKDNKSIYLVPTRWQFIIEVLVLTILSMVKNIIGSKGISFFPFIFSIFLFILTLNLIGLIPYSFTVTSHFAVTFFVSLSIFISINIVGIREHGIRIFSLFLPAGTAFFLSFLLIPIELISYLFKPISLAIRLFCNMMAGHILLKVFAGFAWSLISCSGIIFFLHYFCLLILIPLFLLEVAVAIIQAFVFSLLICIYLNDALNLH